MSDESDEASQTLMLALGELIPGAVVSFVTFVSYVDFEGDRSFCVLTDPQNDLLSMHADATSLSVYTGRLMNRAFDRFIDRNLG